MAQKPRPCLQDMPFHIKKRVADKLERYTDKMALRSIDADFRHVIRDPKAHAIELHLFCREVNEVQWSIEIDDYVLYRCYLQTDKGCLIRQHPKDAGILVKGRKYDQVALEEFQAITDSPNLTVKKMDLTILAKYPILSKLQPGKLKVEDFDVDYNGYQEQVLPVLSHLQPGFLKHINFTVATYMGPPAKNIRWSKLVQLEQWKKLENLKMCEVLTEKIPARYWWHVPELEVKMNDLKPVQAMIEHFRRCETFRYCDITTSGSTLENRRSLGKTLKWIDHKYSLFTGEYPVGPGQFELGVTIKKNLIFIER